MTRWEVLKEHVHDVRRLRNLAMLLRVIESHFKGEVKMEKNLTEYMAKKYRWGNKTTRKNLDILVNLRLLKCLRSPKDHWTKIYYLLDS
ncbi:MAG: hypothetical protein KAW39_02305 [Thermoplasmata archaeon]|nr:hypothetical protein [Candidatus Thermoplasmatota archaeon]MCK4456554.1 hypothetical protein [Thermoplasmata archaeon]